MGLLRMLNRAAFICNLCFLIAAGLLWYKHPISPGFSSLMFVMGFFLSVILNIVVTAALFYRLMARKSIAELPKFLIYANGVFLIIQLIFLIK